MKKGVLIKFLLASLLLCGPQYGQAQDIHYTHITFSPMYTNPAFTGYFNGNLRLYANYRNQYLTVLGGSSFQTYSGAADFSMPVGIYSKDFVGAGLYTFHDRVGKPDDGGQFVTTGIGLSGAYSKSIASRAEHALTLGIMAMYLQRRFAGDEVFFGSQYDAVTGEIIPTPPPGELGPNSTLSYNNFDISLGLMYLGKVSNSLVLYTGFSVAHFIQPRWSFLDAEEARLPIRYAGQLGFNIYLNRRFEIAPFAFYQHQGTIGELTLGNLFDYRIIQDKGIETDIIFGTYIRTLHDPLKPFSFESLMILVGLDYTDLRIAFSYDTQFGGLRNVAKSNSAFEVSLQYTMSWLKTKSITRYCPKF
jgi:type IX secretion system PorP/SprF family membrane protein